MGADAQPFSFAAEDRKCTDIQGAESTIEWLRGQFQPAASSIGSLVSKPLQINPVSRRYLFIGTGLEAFSGLRPKRFYRQADNRGA
jgi:hypothetical protein